MCKDGIEHNYVKEAFDTNWVVPMGPNVNVFEEDLFTVCFCLPAGPYVKDEDVGYSRFLSKRRLKIKSVR